MAFQMQIRINSSQICHYEIIQNLNQITHTHKQRKFAQIQNHTHKNQMCNSKIIKKKKKNSHKILTIENQPNKQTNRTIVKGVGEGFCKIQWG
jgi:hypothetical protein